MSDYYGNPILESWLEEEVFHHNKELPKKVVDRFEKWREEIERSIEAWMDTDDGEGSVSWRGWGRGFNAIPDEDNVELGNAIKQGLRDLGIVTTK